MSQRLGDQIGEAIGIKALREVFVEEPDKRLELRGKNEALEREDPRSVEAFEEREKKVAELMDELRTLGEI